MFDVIKENDWSQLTKTGFKLELNLNKTNISKSGLWLKNKSLMRVMDVVLELVLLEAIGTGEVPQSSQQNPKVEVSDQAGRKD